MEKLQEIDELQLEPTIVAIEHQLEVITRKRKTEAVLQRRSMLKLGVICKFMKRYGKCFM